MLSFSAASYQGDDNNTRAAFKASADSACDLADHTLPPTGPKKTVPAHTEKQQPRSRNVSSIQQQALQPACHRRSYVQHCHAAPTSSRSVLERCRQGCLTVSEPIFDYNLRQLCSGLLCRRKCSAACPRFSLGNCAFATPVPASTDTYNFVRG